MENLTDSIIVAPQALVASALTQVVVVGHGDNGQALMAGIAKDAVGALHQFLGGQTGQCGVQGVDFSQQPHIGVGVDG